MPRPFRFASTLLPVLLAALFWCPAAHGMDLFGKTGEDSFRPRPSLHAYTGLWDMPNARVLPDWEMRFSASSSSPYRYFGAELGLFDRLEIYGEMTEVAGIEAFPGEAFGDYKDRLAGARLVLAEEDGPWPQVAVGLHDVSGTGLFANRYAVLSKQVGPADLTFGLGQGILGGEAVGGSCVEEAPGPGSAGNFQTSTPFRDTRAFFGLEYEIFPELVFAAEYSSITADALFGYPASDILPVNFGLKFSPVPAVSLHAALMRGRDTALGASFSLPLEAEGLFAWKKEREFEVWEKDRWEAHTADDSGLAKLLARKLREDGFTRVRCICTDSAVWAEASNPRYLSDARAFARIGRILDGLAPAHIGTLYINLVEDERIRQSLRTGRGNLRAFLDSRIDRESFLSFAEIELYGAAHWEDFSAGGIPGPPAAPPDKRFFWNMEPKLRTFLGNRSGYVKNKALVSFSAGYEPTPGGLFLGEAEAVLYNDYGSLDFDPLEPSPTRTDAVLYESGEGIRLTQLAYDQIFLLPAGVSGRLSGGYFESAYAGVGAETFRFFADGLLGTGLEAQAVRKRDPDSQLRLMPGESNLFYTCFLNLYAQLWPEQGVDLGLKIGRFLAGDRGVRLDLRRTFNSFTIGVWYTLTDTDVFESAENRGYSDKGVYIRVPFSFFSDREKRGHFNYALSGFTRDQGQTVRQPRSLFPVSPAGLPPHTRSRADDMRMP